MYKSFLKRLIDFSISLVALLLLGWFLLIIAVLLHFTNKGDGAFFLQNRPGKDEKIFKVIKFKSMTEKRDSDGNLLPDKERITPIGRFVRKTSIDELPQLINVLKGDMALIGPRPLLPEYLPYYSEKERLRHTVRPGISGWAQVNGRNNLSWDEKLALDVFYVEHLSFRMDLRVVLATIRNVLSGKDVNVVPSAAKGAGKLNVERAERRMPCM
jgi:lipopolysaccharide/colanic/teichoic acid biosynthesis glycosyltransferase